MTVRAAGIMFVAPGDRVLFLLRAPGGDYPGHWCFPGGRVEGDESLEACAMREAREECGSVPEGDRKDWTRVVSPPPPDNALQADEVDFTTFMQKVPAEFEARIDGEHTGHAWAPADQAPEPLHPGCRVALDRLRMDELGVARAIADGRLASPQKYQNVWLFAIRVTGTGVSYRHKHQEFVWRDKEIYLNDEFLARCNGLPVIFEHPKTSTLDSAEFAKRIVGTVFLPYLRGDEVWAVAKIYDDPTVEIMRREQLSTSPAVVMRDADNTELTLEDGRKLLIEGKPMLMDHVAICEQGVWDKGGEPTGVSTSTDNGEVRMTDEERKAAEAQAKADAEARARADAETSGKLDQLLTGLGVIKSRLDTQDARLDGVVKRLDDDEARRGDEEAEEARKDAEESVAKYSDRKDEDTDESYKDRHDAEESAEAKEREERGEAKEVAADKAKRHRKDAEEKMADKARKDAARKDGGKVRGDSAIDARLKSVEDRLRPMTDAEHKARADAQAEADVVFQAFGDAAPRPLDGETPLAYRRRLVGKLQSHSKTWKDVNVSAIADDAAFSVAQKQIYADALEAAKKPSDLPDGEIRPIIRMDHQTGVRKIEFAGKRSFVGQFKTPTVARVKGFRTANGRDRS